VIIAAIAAGVVLPFAAAALNPAQYDVVWGLFIVIAIGAILVLFVLPPLLRNKGLEPLKMVRQQHPGDVVELVTVWGSGRTPYAANVVVDDSAMLIQSGEGSRRLPWSEVTGLSTVQYGQTYRVGLEIVGRDESVCLMPVSAATLLPVSLARAERFFDAIRTLWRTHGPRNRTAGGTPSPGS